jgi:hypothetical protein
VLKKLWLAAITVTVLFGVSSPGTTYRESSKKWIPCRSETSPSQYGRITSNGTSLIVTRVKSTGASARTASIPYGVTRSRSTITFHTAPSPPREWPITPIRVMSTAPRNVEPNGSPPTVDQRRQRSRCFSMTSPRWRIPLSSTQLPK